MLDTSAWGPLEALLLGRGLQEMKEGLTKRALEKPEVASKLEYIDSIDRMRTEQRLRHLGARRLEAVVMQLISRHSSDALPLNIAMEIVDTFRLNGDLKNEVRKTCNKSKLLVCHIHFIYVYITYIP